MVNIKVICSFIMNVVHISLIYFVSSLTSIILEKGELDDVNDISNLFSFF